MRRLLQLLFNRRVLGAIKTLRLIGKPESTQDVADQLEASGVLADEVAGSQRTSDLLGALSTLIEEVGDAYEDGKMDAGESSRIMTALWALVRVARGR